MFIEELAKTSRGKVSTWLCPDVGTALADLQLVEAGKPDAPKIIAYRWKKLPALEQIVDDSLKSMSEIALSLWPQWYGASLNLTNESALSTEHTIEELLSDSKIQKIRHQIAKPWLKQAIGKCIKGRPPLFRESEFSHDIQVAQLSLVIEPSNFIIILAIEDHDQLKGRLSGLAKAALWFADKTSARVAVLMPEGLAQSEELEPILYRLAKMPPCELEVPVPKPGQKEESNYQFWPLIEGKPHPGSPGEQLLAKYLAKDAQLAGLFSFNCKTRTTLKKTFISDLLWARGKVVVEVDGYEYHSGRAAFSRDRDRDYQLTISGFLVLRLPHAEVVNDVKAAIEKIREIVNFRKQNSGRQAGEDR